jgi:endonuclease V-like protein UPF0215 family
LLKKEARMLGLSATNGESKLRIYIGVVFRGNLWLDGVLACKLDLSRESYLSDLARTIIRCKQYSQIRAVILSGEDIVPGRKTDMSALARKISLPVIAMVPRSRSKQPRTIRKAGILCKIKAQGKMISLRALGMDCESVAEVFRVGCRPGRSTPEAVRIAKLIARQLSNSFSRPESSNA